MRRRISNSACLKIYPNGCSVPFSDPLGTIFSVCFREIRFYISSDRSHLDQQVTLANEISILDP